MESNDTPASPPANLTSRLIHGDCLQIMPTLSANSVAMVFADLPYGVTANKWDKPVELPLLWRCVDAACKKGAAIAMTVQQPFTTKIICSQPHRFRYDIVWHKNRYSGIANAKKAPLRAHETVLIFDARCTYNPQKTYVEKTRTIIRAGAKPKANRNTAMVSQTHTLSNYRFPTSVLKIDRDDKRDGDGHPTQKPVALLEWLIKTYTNPGDTVLDPVAGSGTTAIAALRTGRHVICIEKDPGYFAAMQNRVAKERARLSL